MHRLPIRNLLAASILGVQFAVPCCGAEIEAAPHLPPCAAPLPATGKSRQRYDANALMIVALEVEKQGEANFHLTYKPPTSECFVEEFSVGDALVRATYTAFEKGSSTLEYRFAIHRSDGDSEVLVIYDGMAALVAGGGYIFHVSEERKGVISWYAMFSEAPTYAVIKALVQHIVDGVEKPLMAVRWPPGAKEGEIVAYDSKRLRR